MLNHVAGRQYLILQILFADIDIVSKYYQPVSIAERSKAVVFNLFSPHTPRDTFPLNFVPPKLLVRNSSYT
jgi:hypothetical protein